MNQVQLYPLVYREQDDGWIVGRPETGEFVSVPPVAVTFLRALEGDPAVTAAKRRADTVYDEDVDADAFIADLVELGFVASVDGYLIEAPPPRPPSLRWLRPHHVAWVFRPVVVGVVLAIIVAGIVTGLGRRELPGYTAFYATPDPGVDIAIMLAAMAILVGAHEFWHLAAARAAGIDAWIGLSTRLVFLVAQTAVPGLWLADRRSRLRVYLAGMAADLVAFSAFAFGEALTARPSLPHRIMGELCLLLLMGVAEEFAFYMRTDVYCVVQELTRCKNLYADAIDYLGYRVRRSPARPDPTLDLPSHERRPVRIYAAFVLVGSAATVAFFCWYELPILITGIARSAAEIGDGGPGRIADGVGFIAVIVLLQLLFVRAFLRQHGAKLRRALMGSRRA